MILAAAPNVTSTGPGLGAVADEMVERYPDSLPPASQPAKESIEGVAGEATTVSPLPLLMERPLYSVQIAGAVVGDSLQAAAEWFESVAGETAAASVQQPPAVRMLDRAKEAATAGASPRRLGTKTQYERPEKKHQKRCSHRHLAISIHLQNARGLHATWMNKKSMNAFAQVSE
jgi:hypothetical protein